jgi:hypothetical protein
LGHYESYGPDHSVSIRRPTRPLKVDNIKRLKLVSSGLTVEECQTVGTIRSLESLEIAGPVTDAHLKCLEPLDRLSRLAVGLTKERADGRSIPIGKITQRGIQQLRNITTPIYLHVAPSNYVVDQAMADQFGWRFYGCSSGCCDTVPVGGVQCAIIAGKLKPQAPGAVDHSEEKLLRAVRVRGPQRLERLVVDRRDLPATTDTLCLTDCHIDELHFKGWLPESVRIWGDSHLGKISVSHVADDARLSLRYHFLEGATALTVPASDRLSHVSVTECATLDSLRLDGFYPNLEQLELRGVEKLRYLSAPYRGDAPRLRYPDDSHWAENLPALRLLKVPGTLVGKKRITLDDGTLLKETTEGPRIPPNVVEVDLRDTPIDDDWLMQLATFRHLEVVRIGECRNVTEKMKALFRKLRPSIKLDEQTVHRPGA